jgi:hypothetical protein
VRAVVRSTRIRAARLRHAAERTETGGR